MLFAMLSQKGRVANIPNVIKMLLANNLSKFFIKDKQLLVMVQEVYLKVFLIALF